MKTKTGTTSKGRPDFLLLVLIILLVGFGLVMVFSSSSSIAVADSRYNYDSLYFLKRQIMFAFFGLIGMFACMNMPYLSFQKGIGMLYIVGSLGLLAIVPFIATEVHGARSWLYIGSFGIQPTEFAKLALILYLGRLIAKKGETFRDFKRGLLPVFIILGLFCGLIMKQPDLGGCVIIATTAAFMMVGGGANLKQLATSGLVAVTGFVLFLAVSALFDSDASSYRINRFTSYLHPLDTAQESGFHLVRSLGALGHGGLTGAGFGQSVQKLDYLPFPYNDFIFAIIAEEFGFIGSVVFLLVFLLFLWRGLIVALRCPDTYGTVVGTGIVGLIGFQAFINIGGVIGAIPITGVTLPFISYGGSSIIVVLLCMGVLLSISREYYRSDRTVKASSR
ncbi:putative lipid II flippase FtsW [Paenibacillus sp. MMS18-CY102]|uniref:putative lipid II flippase FtsW n=1 Tax=Paenibacillus sp. MMS18-CY102 TaxID=2682849 RepID=UPI0013659108|nr:putative lipid II flippase FtsW [Paenibacillus sp. MMS18-CY102]MWC26737.1 putative lipid II flippase FtsW [Paenibacillus sp. MMS18-CY102]